MSRKYIKSPKPKTPNQPPFTAKMMLEQQLRNKRRKEDLKSLRIVDTLIRTDMLDITQKDNYKYLNVIAHQHGFSIGMLQMLCNAWAAREKRRKK